MLPKPTSTDSVFNRLYPTPPSRPSSAASQSRSTTSPSPRPLSRSNSRSKDTPTTSTGQKTSSSPHTRSKLTTPDATESAPGIPQTQAAQPQPSRLGRSISSPTTVQHVKAELDYTKPPPSLLPLPSTPSSTQGKNGTKLSPIPEESPSVPSAQQSSTTSTPTPTSVVKRTSEFKAVCRKCSLVFKDEKLYEMHQNERSCGAKIKSGGTIYTCGVCQRRFGERAKLEGHRQSRGHLD